MNDDKNLKPWQERIMKHDEKVGLLNNLLTKIYELQSKGWTIEEIASEVDLPEAFVRNHLRKDILSSAYGTTVNDPVNHPSHYTDGKIEVIDFIEDKKLGFHLGNAVKYIARAGKKNPAKTVEDLEKAIWYIKRYIDDYKEKDGLNVRNGYFATTTISTMNGGKDNG